MIGVRRSLLISFADKYSSQLLFFISTIVLARILTPEDIGVFSVAVAFTTILAMLRDFGVASYLIQEKELTEARFQSALGLVIVTALTMGILLSLSATAIAGFYHKPDMRNAIYVLSLNFLFIPISSIVMTLLRREMNFAAIYRMSVAGALANVTVSITSALLGAGFMSLAYGSLASSIATSAMAYRQRPRQLRMVPRLSEWRHVASFSALATATTLIMELNKRTPDLAIGREIGLSPLGLFSRANGLVTLITDSLVTPVMAVLLSVFSVKNRESGEMKFAYLTSLSMLTAITWPLFIIIAAMAFPVIHILYGAKWDAAAPICRFTCIGGAFSALWGLQYAVLQGTGAVRQNLRVTITTGLLRGALVITASLHGLVYAAMAGAAASLFSFIIVQHEVNRIVQCGFFEVFAAVRLSLAIAIVAGIIPTLAGFYVGNSTRHLWFPLILSISSSGTIWIASLYLTDHPLREELGIVFDKLRTLASMALARKSRQVIMRLK